MGDCLRPRIRRGSRIGLSAIIPTRHDGGVIRMACGRRGYVGSVALEDGTTNYAAALDPEAIREQGDPASAIRSIIGESAWPAPAALELARWHGTAPLTRRRPALYRPGLLFLGDAAGYVEPFTGEGMAWAISSALIAARLIAEGRPQVWPRSYARSIRARQRTCRVVSWALRRPRLAALGVRLLAAFPRAGAPLSLAVHRPIAGAIP